MFKYSKIYAPSSFSLLNYLELSFTNRGIVTLVNLKKPEQSILTNFLWSLSNTQIVPQPTNNSPSYCNRTLKETVTPLGDNNWQLCAVFKNPGEERSLWSPPAGSQSQLETLPSTLTTKPQSFLASGDCHVERAACYTDSR